MNLKGEREGKRRRETGREGEGEGGGRGRGKWGWGRETGKRPGALPLLGSKGSMYV